MRRVEQLVIKRAVIIAVGSELLTPDKVDTNSLFLTERLNELGIEVRRKIVVGDEDDELDTVLKESIQLGGLFIVTGGLGPTDDDRTRDIVASTLGLSLTEDVEILEGIRDRFSARGLNMPDVNRRQAFVPAGANVLRNRYGTAPGLWLASSKAIFVLLPGPPRELQPMFEEEAMPLLKDITSGDGVYRRVLRIAGRTESYVESKVFPVYSAWRKERPRIDTTILSTLGQIELRLSMVSSNRAEADSRLDHATGQLERTLNEDLFSSDGSSLEEIVGNLLCQRGLRLAVAESCTGGLVTSRLTDIPGSSRYVHAGWVLYSNEAKIRLLGIEPEMLETKGAVSREVAEAMALGARRIAEVDFGIGVTGIAGPGGGTKEKPSGTVWVALAGPGVELFVRGFQLPGERERVKYQASQVALDMVRRALLKLS